jgi:chromosome segregation ATPase
MSDWPESLADARERIIMLEAEIERLTHTLKAAQEGLKEYGDEMVEARAEIERLRAEKLHWEEQNGLLEAEIERLLT